MAELYRFFDGTVSDPRSYSADDFAEYFRQFIRNGVFNGGDELQVSSQQVGLKTYVKPGKAWIDGYFYKNTDNLFLDHNASHATMDRIDRVVLRIDYGLRTMGVRVLTGVPGATPQPPALTRNNNVYELSLAQVKIKAGAVSVSPTNIVDERFNGNVCGIVTHLFEDANAIFSYFQNEWEKWFSEIEGTTNLVPRTDAILLRSIPEFRLAVQIPELMERMVEQFLVLDVIVQNEIAMDAVASSEVAMDAIINNAMALDKVVSSEVAMDAVASSEVAMDAVASSEVAMDAVASSEIAMDAVASSEVAMDAVASSEVAMDAVASSEVAMDAVASSEVAMDAVASSEVAMDAVASSEVAMDAVGRVSMAIGKLAVGLAGLSPTDYADMDAVASSEVAMDAVASSEVAMDAVASSEVAMEAVASSEVATTAMIKQGLPYAFENAAATHNASDGFLLITRNTASGTSNFVELSTTLDFTGKTTLNIWASADTLGETSNRMKALVRIGGSTMLELDGNQTALTKRAIDVSGLTGRQKVELGYSSTSSGASDKYTVRFSKFFLE